MGTCYDCGEEIEFRYIDGRPTPIHVQGGWCSGRSNSSTSAQTKPFRARESYTNPNAICPVCGEKVFFYQSPSGGRVFFDDLGWPWPKHGCTDNPKSQYAKIQPIESASRKPFVSKTGKVVEIYLLDRFYYENQSLIIEIINIKSGSFRKKFVIPRDMVHAAKIVEADFQNAPSFTVFEHGERKIVSFISARKQKIISLKLL